MNTLERIAPPSSSGSAQRTSLRAARGGASVLDRFARRLVLALFPRMHGGELTVIHDEFPAESVVRELVSGGWPHKLADLKSGLEAS